MRIFFSFNSLRCVLSLCFSLAVIIVGACTGYAQCPSAKSTGCSSAKGSNLSFPRGQTVYVDIDLRIWNTPQYTQITAALDLWNDANQSNGSGVVFDYGGVPTGPEAVNVLHILNGTLTTRSGDPDPTRAANIRYGRYNSNTGEVYEATITFNTGAALANSSNPSSPYYGQPYYNPNEPDYNTVFLKKTMHETGHGMGLCDVPAAAQQPGHSVMNTGRENCPNDTCGEQPSHCATVR